MNSTHVRTDVRQRRDANPGRENVFLNRDVASEWKCARFSDI